MYEYSEITISTQTTTPTGTYPIIVTGTAEASSVSTSFNLTVNPQPVDTTPPTVSITSPATMLLFLELLQLPPMLPIMLE
jgi:hypothetical protein